MEKLQQMVSMPKGDRDIAFYSIKLWLDREDLAANEAIHWCQQLGWSCRGQFPSRLKISVRRLFQIFHTDLLTYFSESTRPKIVERARRVDHVL